MIRLIHQKFVFCFVLYMYSFFQQSTPSESHLQQTAELQMEKQQKQQETPAIAHAEPIVAMPISKFVEMIQAICAQGSQTGEPFWQDPEKTMCLAANFLVPLQRMLSLFVM